MSTNGFFTKTVLPSHLMEESQSQGTSSRGPDVLGTAERRAIVARLGRPPPSPQSAGYVLSPISTLSLVSLGADSPSPPPSPLPQLAKHSRQPPRWGAPPSSSAASSSSFVSTSSESHSGKSPRPLRQHSDGGYSGKKVLSPTPATVSNEDDMASRAGRSGVGPASPSMKSMYRSLARRLRLKDAASFSGTATPSMPMCTVKNADTMEPLVQKVETADPSVSRVSPGPTRGRKLSRAMSSYLSRPADSDNAFVSHKKSIGGWRESSSMKKNGSSANKGIPGVSRKKSFIGMRTRSSVEETSPYVARECTELPQNERSVSKGNPGVARKKSFIGMRTRSSVEGSSWHAAGDYTELSRKKSYIGLRTNPCTRDTSRATNKDSMGLSRKKGFSAMWTSDTSHETTNGSTKL